LKPEKKGLLFVFSAPSGSGKTSVLAEVLKIHPDILFSISVTTRPPREGERNGVNYYFVTDEEFDSYIESGDFAEWAVVYDNRYGTLKRTIKGALENNRTMILDTDTVGAFNIKKLYPDAVLVFIAPPSPEMLSKRLRNRNTESGELITKRLEAAPLEMSRMSDYDYIVLNDEISKAVSRISTIINAEKLRNEQILPSLTSWREYINESETDGN